MNPVRTCVGCRGRAPQSSLLRLVRDADTLIAATRPRLPGRGAYLHATKSCLAQAIRRRALSRALGIAVTYETASAALGWNQEPDESRVS
ncbi:MAG: YlxR family protein [Arachnia sp.]